MKRLFDSMKENDRRRYAAIEALKRGARRDRARGEGLGLRPQDHPRGTGGVGERGQPGRGGPEKGGGGKRLIEVDPTIEANIPTVLEDHTAGDPMRALVEQKRISRSEKKLNLDFALATVAHRTMA